MVVKKFYNYGRSPAIFYFLWHLVIGLAYLQAGTADEEKSPRKRRSRKKKVEE